MNASATLRKLKDLDQLETRVKAMVNPSPKMLNDIKKNREELLAGNPQEEMKK